MKNKKVILLFGLIVILSGWWITGKDTQTPPEAGVIDVWATWGEGPDQLQAFFDRFSQFSGLPVRVTSRIRSDDLMESLAGNEVPDLVILSSADLVATYHKQGLVQPLDRWIDAASFNLEDIFPAPLEQCKSPEGAYLCHPWGCDIDALFWNKDLFKAAGLDPERPPRSMEEVVEYAEKLTMRSEDGELLQVGFIPDFPRSHAELYVRMFGGSPPSEEDVDFSMNSQPVSDALNWQQQFYDHFTPDEINDFIASFTPYMSSTHPIYAGRRLSCRQCHRAEPIRNNKTPEVAFTEGRIAMMVAGQWQSNFNDLADEFSQVNYGVTPFPPPSTHPDRAYTSVVQGPVAIVPSGALDAEAAAQLLAWMTSPEILAEAAYANASLPTSRTAAADPRFHQPPQIGVFLDLLAHPNAGRRFEMPMSIELSQKFSVLNK